MPLSRHFYSLDDVQSSLYYSSIHRDMAETLFWSHELLTSHSIAECISTLFESWLWNIGPLRLQWLLDSWNTLASDSLHEQDIYLATYRLRSLHRTHHDSSLWHILVLTTQSPHQPPDHITPKTPPTLPSQYNNKELYFIRSLYQGKARCAWWIACSINPIRIWELLRWYAQTYSTSSMLQVLDILPNYDKLLGYQSNEYDRIVLCLAILSCCLSPDQQKESFRPLSTSIDSHHQSILSTYQTHLGKKNARIYSIPSSSLYGTTVRGTLHWSQDNVKQLHHVEKYMIGCPFWEEAIQKYGTISEKGNIEWNSEDAMESFYQQYFPDEIPDEWTAVEKAKSHGTGVLGPTETIHLWKYSSRFLSHSAVFAWNTTHQVISYLQTLSNYTLPLSFIDLYSSLEWKVQESQLIPVRIQRSSES